VNTFAIVNETPFIATELLEFKNFLRFLFIEKYKYQDFPYIHFFLSFEIVSI